MTNPEVLMYWMLNFSEYACCLTCNDRDNLVNKGLFKDQKAISDAIYQLKKNDYVCDIYGKASIVCLTEKGLNYITQVLRQAGNQQTLQFNTATEELARLQEENEKLKVENKILNASVKFLLASNDRWEKTCKMLSSQRDELRGENEALHKKYDQFEKCIEAFMSSAKIFNDIAQSFK